MGTQIYRNNDEERVPSVTTVLKNLGWSTPALMYWANNEGLEGRKLYESKEATDIGTIAHGAVEAHIKKEKYDIKKFGLTDAQNQKVNACLDAFTSWHKQSKIKIIHSELAMVSEVHQFGGTCDHIGVLKKQHVLIDIKTSKGIYEDYLCQVRAYGALWDESHEGEEIKEYHIIRLGKDEGDFHHHVWQADSDAMNNALVVFKHLLDLHRIHPALKKVAA